MKNIIEYLTYHEYNKRLVVFLTFSFALEYPAPNTESFNIKCNRYLSISTDGSHRILSSLSQIDIQEDTATSLSTCSSSNKVSLLNEM